MEVDVSGRCVLSKPTRSNPSEREADGRLPNSNGELKKLSGLSWSTWYYQNDSDKREAFKKVARKYYHANKGSCTERNKKWREKNKELIRKKQRENKRERKLWAIQILGSKCKMCGGEFHPSVYEFHHRNPEEKDRDPSKMLQLKKEKLTAELAKCDLLCANCHRITHHGVEYGS